MSGQTPPPSGTVRRDTTTALRADQRYRYRLLGVYDERTGDPLEGVEVQDVLSGLSSVTTKTGTLSLFFLPDGGSLVRLRKVGYELQTLPIAISPADTSPVTIVLRRVADLPVVVVKDSAPKYRSPRLQAAEARIAMHVGYSIDETVMRKNDNSTLADLLRSRMPGLMSVAGQHGETYFVSARKPCLQTFGCRQPNCFVSLFIDGIKSTVLPDFDRLAPQDYAIAEYYPGGAEVPAEYGGLQSPCGALLLWTREQ